MLITPERIHGALSPKYLAEITNVSGKFHREVCEMLSVPSGLSGRGEEGFQLPAAKTAQRLQRDAESARSLGTHNCTTGSN